MLKDYGKVLVGLAENLNLRFGNQLSIYDLEGEPGAHRVAYNLLEIYESAEKLIARVNSLSEGRVCSEELSTGSLSDIKEELQHLLYHIKDSGIFSDLLDEVS